MLRFDNVEEHLFLILKPSLTSSLLNAHQIGLTSYDPRDKQSQKLENSYKNLISRFLLKIFALRKVANLLL